MPFLFFFNASLSIMSWCKRKMTRYFFDMHEKKSRIGFATAAVIYLHFLGVPISTCPQKCNKNNYLTFHFKHPYAMRRMNKNHDCALNNWPTWVQKVPKGAKRSVKMWNINFYKSYFKNVLLYRNGRLYTYIIPRTVYFDWICTCSWKELLTSNFWQ